MVSLEGKYGLISGMIAGLQIGRNAFPDSLNQPSGGVAALVRVIPAQAGTQFCRNVTRGSLVSRLRGNDEFGMCCRIVRQVMISETTRP